MTDILSGLIGVWIVCKGYGQMTKNVTSVLKACWILTPLAKIKKYLCKGQPTLPKLDFFQVLWKNIILCILKGEMPFKLHKINFSRIF